VSTILHTEHVTRRLEGEVPVTLVNDVTLKVEQGEFLVITGPSGSGKSSLLYLLGLLDTPTSGHIWLDDKEMTQLDEETLAAIRLEKLGFVFQSHFLLPEFSALENVMLPMKRLGKLDNGDAVSRATDLLTDLGLGDQLHKIPRQLSGGQSQRVAIARALANDPEIILADEPTGNLDTKSSSVVQGIMHDLTKLGRTLIVVTHQQDFAASASRIITIVDGRLA